MVSSTTNKAIATKNFIEMTVANNDVVVFSKSYCPYCKATKRTLSTDLNIEAKVFELDKMPNGGDIQRVLLQLTGQRTVPNVWVKGKHLGGNDDTQDAVASGELQEQLKA